MFERSLVFILFGIFCKKEIWASNSENLPGSAALDNFPLVDGHNDLPHNLYLQLNNTLENFHFERNLTTDPVFGSNICNCHTDIPRLRQGKVGAQFWVAYVECRYDNFVARTLDQIDVIKRLINKYSNDLEYVTTADGIVKAFKQKKIGSLIGVEGGHSIDNRLSILRIFYELGVRYLTLTHNCDLAWAESSYGEIRNNDSYIGLTEFGKKVVLEMNRLGMMVDLAHVSRRVMYSVLNVSRAPVIFSHSSARAIYYHVRNVEDDVLKKLVKNGGIIMVNFFSTFIARENATIRDVVDHINHIVDVTGFDHVGIGSDFDGVPYTPMGLENVSKYPDLFNLLKELNPERWTIENLEKLAGRNFVRVFRQVEKIKETLSSELPAEDILEDEDHYN